MTAEMISKRGALLRNVALCITAVTFVIAWLPLVRSLLDGPSYQWGATFFGRSFSGAGLGGDFWFLLAQGALALTVLGLGFRRPGVPFYTLLIGWLALNAANIAYGLINNPQALVFEGATLGVRVNIGPLALAIYAAALLCAVAAALLEYANGRRPPRFAWTAANTAAVAAAAALLPLQYILLREASGQDLADQIGVILTMTQWFALVIALGLSRRTPLDGRYSSPS
jgi:hypothetical protein